MDKLKNVPTGLNRLESKVDNFNIRKLETTPIDLAHVKLPFTDEIADFVKKEIQNRFSWKTKIKKKELLQINQKM